MTPIISLHIDNEPTRLSRFAVPEMHLSSSRATMRQHTFLITLSADALVQYLEPAYATWVTESKEDDVTCDGPQDELALAGYPDLRQLLDTPSLLRLVVGRYLLREWLGALTGDGPVEYWLDSVSGCQSDKGLVHLSGTCCSNEPRDDA